MFWKLAFTITVIMLIAGRTPVLRNPLIRLFLPRSLVAGLSALPQRRITPPGQAEPSSRSLLVRRSRIILIAIALAGLAAWMATRALISSEGGGLTAPPAPTPTASP